MAGVHFEAGAHAGDASRGGDALELARDAGGIAFERALAIGAGVQLDDVGAERARRLDRRRIGLDEQRHADAGVLQGARRYGADCAPPPTTFEPALGGALLALFRHEAAGVGQVAQRDGQHLVGRRHLQVERTRQLGLEPGDVVVGDVAAILAQVRGDAVGAGLDGEMRGAQRIGMAAAARVADGGDVVDVDAEAQVGRRCACGNGQDIASGSGLRRPQPDCPVHNTQPPAAERARSAKYSRRLPP